MLGKQEKIRDVRLGSVDDARGGLFDTIGIKIELGIGDRKLSLSDLEVAKKDLPYKEFSGILGINFFSSFRSVFIINQDKLILQTVK